VIAVVAIVLIALVAGGMMSVMTRWGAGLTTDSLTYLRAAALFERGYGLVQPDPAGQLASPHFPPLYPLVISALTFDGGRLATTARWLNVSLLMLNVCLIGALAWRASGSRGAAVAASALLAASSPLLELHVWAWSEPMFLASMMVALLLLSRALSAGSRRALLLAALATGAGCATRYAGIALIAGGCLGILVLAPWTIRRRLLAAIAFGAIAAAPLAMWMFRNRTLTETAVNRGIQLLGFDQRDFERVYQTLLQWLMPLPLGLHLNTTVWFVTLTLAAMAWLTIIIHRRAVADPDRSTAGQEQRPATVLRQLLLVFVPCYVGLVLASIGLLDSTTPLDNRILSPVQIALIVGVVAAGGRAAWVWRRSPHRVGLWIGCGAAVLVGINVYSSIDLVRHATGRGLGLASRKWVESAVIREAASLPPTIGIYSNMPELIEVHLGRPAEILPRPYNRSTHTPYANYPARVRRAAKELRSSDGAVVWFRRASRSDQFESEIKLVRKLGVGRTYQSRDGAIYRVVREPEKPPPTTASIRRRKHAVIAERRAQEAKQRETGKSGANE
jgi:4-amino-4-deoxy-L-arabinose transferase-like glycosyltransferase